MGKRDEECGCVGQFGMRRKTEMCGNAVVIAQNDETLKA